MQQPLNLQFLIATPEFTKCRDGCHTGDPCQLTGLRMGHDSHFPKFCSNPAVELRKLQIQITGTFRFPGRIIRREILFEMRNLLAATQMPFDARMQFIDLGLEDAIRGPSCESRIALIASFDCANNRMSVRELLDFLELIRLSESARGDEDVRPKHLELFGQRFAGIHSLKSARPPQTIDAALEEKRVRIVLVRE